MTLFKLPFIFLLYHILIALKYISGEGRIYKLLQPFKNKL